MAMDRHLTAEDLAILNSRTVSTGPSVVLAVAVARPERTARAAAAASMESDLPCRLSGGLVGLVDLGDRDAFMVQTAGKGGSVGAGALHTGPLQLPKSTCPAQELAVALPGRWEASSVQQEPGAGDDRSHVDVFVRVDSEQDLFILISRVVTWLALLSHAGHGRLPPDRLGNTGGRRRNGVAVRTVTVPVAKAPIGTRPTVSVAARTASDSSRQIKRKAARPVVSRARPPPKAAPQHPHSRIW